MPASTKPNATKPNSTKSKKANQKKSDGNQVCYIYGIVPGDLEFTEEVTGVGDPPSRVKLVRHGGIAALVSEISSDQPLGTPEDLMAHADVLDSVAAAAPVLPLRFGAVVTDCDAVSGELLAEHEPEFRDALSELEGLAEFVVKGRYVEDAIVREVLDENEEARSLREAIRGTSEAQSRDQRIQLGELIGNAIGAKRDRDTQAVVDRLTPYCKSISIREPSHEQDAVHLALLIETDRQQDVEDALTELQNGWDGRVALRLLGPLAPYDFVVSTPS